MPPHPTPPVLHRQSGTELRPTRHVVIKGGVSLIEAALMLLPAVLIGLWLAVGHS